MSDESKSFEGTVLVVGSTGYVGQATVNALSSKFGASATIKAGTRNPESDKAKALAKLAGVTAVKASMGAPETVTEEAKGADVVILITPGAEDRADLTIAGAKAAVAAGVTNLAVVSVPFKESSTHLFARQLKAIEAGVREASADAVLLKLPLFTDNQWGNAGTIKGMGKIFAPGKPDAKYATVTVGDAGAAFAAVAGNFAAHKGKSYTLTSDSLSGNEIAAAFAAELGKEVTYVQVPNEAAKKAMMDMGLPEWQVDGIIELYDLINAGEDFMVDTSEDLATLLGKPATSTAAWIKACKAGFQ